MQWCNFSFLAYLGGSSPLQAKSETACLGAVAHSHLKTNFAPLKIPWGRGGAKFEFFHEKKLK